MLPLFMELDFQKMPDQLIPAIVQDADTSQVLMLGYVNAEAWTRTQAEGRVTFYSRARKQLWTKGKTSGNYLHVISLHVDCDQDAVLILARPAGPTCHRGTTTCFELLAGGIREITSTNSPASSEPLAPVAVATPITSSPAVNAGGVAATEQKMMDLSLLAELDNLIARRQEFPAEEPGSYTVRLLQKGLARIAQKVGEEAVETVIEAMAGNRVALAGEAADLLYHLLVLLRVSGSSLAELLAVLQQRHLIIVGGQRRPLPE